MLESSFIPHKLRFSARGFLAFITKILISVGTSNNFPWSMEYQIDYRRYRQPFRFSLRAHWGVWTERVGYWIKIEDAQGNIGFGEVAPIDGFSQETLKSVEQELKGFKGFLNLTQALNSVSACLAFALDGAHQQLLNWPNFPILQTDLKVAGLLPAGKKALEVLPSLLDRGYTAFKWKVGVEPLSDELDCCQQLLSKIDGKAKLRLDANGAWTRAQAETWLKNLPSHSIDYLEQPLPVGEEGVMAELAEAYPLTIALDESVLSDHDLATALRLFPQGPFVIKPALLGSVSAIQLWRKQHPQVSLIYSSAFETVLGVEASLRLAASDPNAQQALGYGVSHYWNKSFLNCHTAGPSIRILSWSSSDFEKLWQQL